MATDDSVLTRRCFVALPLDPATREVISALQQQLHRQLPDLRLPQPDTLHLTLRFFAGLTEEQLEKIAVTMVSIGSFFAPFSLPLSQLGAFPAPDRAQVFWLGGESSPLQALFRAVDDGLDSAGLPGEARPFRPHITIARSRKKPAEARHILSQLGVKLDLRLPVDRLVLYESRLQATGALHLPRHTVLLTGGGRTG